MLPPRGEFAGLVARALAKRAGVARATDAYRVVDDRADGLPGVVIDRYAEFAVLSLFTGEAEAEAAPLAGALIDAGIRGVYAKRRVRADLRRASKEELSPEAPLSGEAAPVDLVVVENGMKFRVDLSSGLSTGLFADQRETRAMVCESAAGARVLNLFAYTCSFTVAAALGGASTTTSVDVSQRALSRGNDNLVLNGVAGDSHRLLRGDAMSFVKRARRREERFDIVVLDPPSFGTNQRGTFSAPRDYAKIAGDVLALLAPSGRLVAVTNHLGTSRAALRAIIERAAASARVRLDGMLDLPMPADYVFRPNGEEPTKTVIVKVAG
jgi:23S rRNA (cytosine1962-C5)-methyltransferase